MELDTEADIVLLVGPNGVGKSSLLEALALALVNRRVNAPATGASGAATSLGSRRVDTGHIEVRLDRDLQPIRISITGTDTIRNAPDWDQRVKSQFERDKEVPWDLLYRATSWFQDDFRAILDENAPNTTSLLQWAAGVTPNVASLRESLDARVTRNTHIPHADRTTPHPAVTQAWAEASQAWAQLVDGLGAHAPPAPRAPRESGASATFQSAIETWLHRPAAGESFRGAVEVWRSALEWLTPLLASQERQEVAALRAERDRLLAQLPAGIDPAAARALTGVADLPHLLRTLHAQRRGWIEALKTLERPSASKLARVRQELERLDPPTIEVWGRQLEEVLGSLRRLLEIESRLEEVAVDATPDQVLGALGTLDAALKTLKERAEAEDDRRHELRDAARRRRGAAASQRVSLEVQALREWVGRQSAGGTEREKEVLAQLYEALDNTLYRFDLGTSAFPIRFHDEGTTRWLTTPDKRAWSDLSTGQRGQLALSLMLTQALLLREKLPARVLLLDDPSSAFDLGNIAKQTTLLRQLAYTDEPGHRWQIFLASHHGELSARLLDLLHPPAGRTLRVVEFSGWTPAEGPSYKEHTIEGKSPEDEWKRLCETLRGPLRTDAVIAPGVEKT